jgi:hypothetical protein
MKIIDKLISFLVDTKEDLQAFDEHVQEEIMKYRNQQCTKAFLVGCFIGGLISGIANLLF